MELIRRKWSPHLTTILLRDPNGIPIAQVPTVYEVELPMDMERLLDSFTVVVSFGFSYVSTPLQCLRLDGYRAELLFWIICPIALILAGVLFALGGMLFAHKRSREALLKLSLPWILRLLFFIYPLVTTVAFDAFPCFEFEDGSRFLKKDVSIECDTAEHEVAKWLACVAIVIYPVGIFVLFASLLGYVRRDVQNAEPTMLKKATAFLHDDYEPHLFWWEPQSCDEQRLPSPVPSAPPPPVALCALQVGACGDAAPLHSHWPHGRRVQRLDSPAGDRGACLGRPAPAAGAGRAV